MSRRGKSTEGGPYTIREVRERDRDALDALWAEIDALHVSLQPRYFRNGTRPDTFLREAIGDPHRALLCAELGGVLAGVVDVRIYDTPSHPLMAPCRRAFVDDLVVARTARRRGIGRALMDAAHGWAREHRAGELVLTVWAGNEDAERFYTRLGYRPLNAVLSLVLE